MSHLLISGLSHKTAGLKLRERLNVSPDEMPCALRRLAQDGSIAEAVLLCTCNRVELYCLASGDQPTATETLISLLADFSSVPVEDFADMLYHHRDEDAVAHLFKVASGLDSLALGETQVLAQTKDAFATSQNHETTGKYLNTLFQHAFSTAKRVHSETRISSAKTSVPSVAVEFASDLFSTFADKTLLQIGSGETGQLTLKHFSDHSLDKVLLTSRTFSKAQSIAREFDADAFPFEDLQKNLFKADIIVSAVRAENHVITRETMESAIHSRRNRPVFLLDLSVPRAISPEISQIDNVFLYDIDDLQQVVERNMEMRQAELSKCLEIIEEETRDFLAQVEGWRVDPFIKDLREHADTIREHEWRRLESQLTGLAPELKGELEHMTKRIVNKILHHPITTIRAEMHDRRGLKIMELARKLFFPPSKKT